MGLLHNCRRTAAGLPRSCCTAAVELCSSCLSVSDDHGGGDMDQFNHVRALLGQKKTPRKVETHKVCQASNRLSSFMELPKVDKVHKLYKTDQSPSSLSSVIMFILMLTWLIFEKVYKSSANNDDFQKLTAIILMPTKFNFENVY